MTPGTSAVFSAHAFIVYKLVAQLFGIEQREIPMTDGLVHDLEAMLAAIDETTTVVFVCNPNNPTGTMAANDAIVDFMSRVPDHVLVVFDEAYAEIALSEMPDTMQYVHAERSVIITRTFSKAYGLAGLRVGYGIAPAPVIAALLQARQPFNVNLLAQVAGCAALDDDAFIAAGRAVYRAGRTTIEDACKKLRLRFIPTHANFMLIEAGRKGTADMNGGAVTQALQERGVIVRPVAGYGLPQYFRVNFGTASENQRFVEALADVLKT
jgi:histidinol-phosphate aminotransferase